MTATSVAVVGGGIVGASVAYHLSERTNGRIVVYERDGLASETTSRSTSMIGVAGPDPHPRMKEYGLRLYNEFFADPAASPRYQQSGRLRVATSASNATKLERLAAVDSAETDGPELNDPDVARFATGPGYYVPGERLRSRFLIPPLDTELVEGALYRPEYGYVQDESGTLGAEELAFEFVERARDNGVAFETDTEVTDITTDGDAVTGIETDGAEFVDADAVVCAAGPWNARLAASIGLEVPVEHTLSPVFSLELDRPFPYTMPMIKSHESSVGLHTKSEDTVLVTYTPDDDEGEPRYDPSAVGDRAPDDHRRVAMRWAKRLLPVLENAELVDEWVGIGTKTPDGSPIVGWTTIEGLFLAVTMSGIQFAPAVGSIVARQLVDGDPTEYYGSVSISRFDGHTDWWSANSSTK